MNIDLSFVWTHSKWLTTVALLFALVGTTLLGWGYLKWENIVRAKFSSEFGVITGMTFSIRKEKAGFILIIISIIIQLIVQFTK